ncbi:MAG TPA: hypothetical protein VKA19_15475 [Alphaproteobacteria bacterium]|nr:hypothetical protein [Alphaproteobacteria bacterium]
MPSKTFIALAGATLLAASASSVYAACVRPNEQRADRVRALQTRLMVGALKCGKYDGVDIRASYNAFVTRFSPQLTAHSKVLKGYFRRTGGSVYRTRMDSHITELANAASLQSNASGFCAHIAALARATAHETPDQVIDRGEAPGLPVKLGTMCAAESDLVDELGHAAATSTDKRISRGAVEARANSPSE